MFTSVTSRNFRICLHTFTRKNADISTNISPFPFPLWSSNLNPPKWYACRKYDLKEEYADCLLLCRHCRCLFWKSFGHPCIINEEEEDELAQARASVDQSKEQTYKQHDVATTRRNVAASSGAVYQHELGCSSANICNCDRRQSVETSAVSSNQSATTSTVTMSQGQITASNDNNNSSSNSDRNAGPSVAMLSRNFDSRAQECQGAASAQPTSGTCPISSTSAATRPPFTAASVGRAAPPMGYRQAPADDSRANVDNSSARVPLRDLNAQQLNNRIRNILGHNENRARNNNNNSDSNNNNNARTSRRREDLVPKHVTITPQAFLKFFSL